MSAAATAANNMDASSTKKGSDASLALLEDGTGAAPAAAASGGTPVDGGLSADAQELQQQQQQQPPPVGSAAWWWSKACCVHPLLILVQFIFSGYHVLTSTALQSKGVNALVFALYRELSASVLIAGLAAIAVRRGGHRWRIERRHLPRFLAMGLFSAGNVLGAVQSLTLISATNFAVLQPSIPVFTMVLSVLFRMERLTPLKALGLAAAVAGAVCVEVVGPDTSFGSGSKADFVYGNVVVILQCLSMGSLLVAQKVVLEVYHPTVVTAWYYSIGSILTLVICICKNLPAEAYALSTDYRPWLALAYAAAFGTAFNYNAYSFAGTVVAPGVISIYSTLQPLGTAVLSFIFLHSKATTGEILGGVLVIIGLVVTVAARDIEARWQKKKQAEVAAAAAAVGGGGEEEDGGAGGSSRRDSKEVPLVVARDEEAGRGK